ncbi:MAG: o-succinylbenzoate synthase [Chloroflexi bacterium RBG_16_48_8]|nr:MAG: o-succinylbenzoate synthase [Chloroflexi bacterium RBG_16_48_8]
MKLHIDEIEIRHIRMRLRSPFQTSFGVELDRDCIILCLRSDGIEGWGECVASSFPGYNYETAETARHVLRDFFIPTILGDWIEDVQSYQDRIGHYRGHNLARAGLEMALWDLFGKARGQSLSAMLGGVRTSVPVGVSIGIKEDEASLLEIVSDYINQGYRRIKLKIKPGRDIAVVKPVRENHPELLLQVDANSAYELSHAPIFQSMDDLNLVLIEQPLAEDDIIDHRQLQAQLKTPLCLDESILCLRHARQALQLEACRIINIKPGRVGGLSEAVRIHDFCRAKEVPVWCGGMLETNIGRASNLALASLPGFTLPGDISASDRYYEIDIAEPSFSLNEDSTIDVPEGPGLGVSVEVEALDHFTLRKETWKA